MRFSVARIGLDQITCIDPLVRQSILRKKNGNDTRTEQFSEADHLIVGPIVGGIRLADQLLPSLPDRFQCALKIFGDSLGKEFVTNGQMP